MGVSMSGPPRIDGASTASFYGQSDAATQRKSPAHLSGHDPCLLGTELVNFAEGTSYIQAVSSCYSQLGGCLPHVGQPRAVPVVT